MKCFAQGKHVQMLKLQGAFLYPKIVWNIFQGILHDLNKNHDVIKLVTQSLVKCHKQAMSNVGDGQLGPDTMVDGRYPHSEVNIAYMSSLRILGGVSGFCTLYPPLCNLPPGKTKSSDFRLSLQISPDLRVISLKSNKIVCFYSSYGLSKTINWQQLAQNDHRRQLRQLSQMIIFVN